MKLPLILFILAVPVAFILLPYPFEVLATILFVGLFLLVAVYDYLHAAHVQHPEHPHPQATPGGDKPSPRIGLTT